MSIDETAEQLRGIAAEVRATGYDFYAKVLSSYAAKLDGRGGLTPATAAGRQHIQQAIAGIARLETQMGGDARMIAAIEKAAALPLDIGEAEGPSPESQPPSGRDTDPIREPWGPGYW